MRAYNELLDDILNNGETRGDRTGTGTISVFGRSFRHDMSRSFPLLTAKRVPFKSVAAELLWFLAGGTNIIPLLRDGCSIWTDWPLAAYNKHLVTHAQAPLSQHEFQTKLLDGSIEERWGDLGPVYGAMWRAFPAFDRDGFTGHNPGGTTFDQIGAILDQIRNNPESRRIMVSAWNPALVSEQALPPCHFAFQLYCHTDGRLSLQMHMRSTDIFLGLPFNIASYGALLHMIAAVTDRKAGDLIITFGDLHLYSNHLEQATEFLSRSRPAPPTFELPVHSYLEDYTLDDLTGALKGYNPLAAIKAEVAV